MWHFDKAKFPALLSLLCDPSLNPPKRRIYVSAATVTQWCRVLQYQMKAFIVNHVLIHAQQSICLLTLSRKYLTEIPQRYLRGDIHYLRVLRFSIISLGFWKVLQTHNDPSTPSSLYSALLCVCVSKYGHGKAGSTQESRIQSGGRELVGVDLHQPLGEFEGSIQRQSSKDESRDGKGAPWHSKV